MWQRGKTDPPSNVSGVSLLPIDETSAILSWDRATELDVLLGGKTLIRHSSKTTGAQWKDGQNIVVAAAGNQTQKIVPLLAGTYLIKFEDDGGRESPSPGSRILIGIILELQQIYQHHLKDFLWEVLMNIHQTLRVQKQIQFMIQL